MQTRIGVQISFDALAPVSAPEMAAVPVQAQAGLGADLAALFSETLQSAFGEPSDSAADALISEQPQQQLRPKQGDEAALAGVLGSFPFFPTPLQITPAAPIPVEDSAAAGVELVEGSAAGVELSVNTAPAAAAANSITTESLTTPATVLATDVPPGGETRHIVEEAAGGEPIEKNLAPALEPESAGSVTHTKHPVGDEKITGTAPLPRATPSEAEINTLPSGASDLQSDAPIAPKSNSDVKVDAGPLRSTNRPVRGSRPEIALEAGFELASSEDQKMVEGLQEAPLAPAPVHTPEAPAQAQAAPAQSPRPAPLPATPEIQPVAAPVRDAGELAFAAEISEPHQVPSEPTDAPEQTVQGALTNFADAFAATGQTDSHVSLPAEAGISRPPTSASPPVFQRTEPAPVAEPAQVAAVREVQEQARPAAQGIAFQIGERDERIHVHLRERDGAIQVAVRSPNPEVAQSLRSNLGDLSGQLQNAGFRSEIVTPVSSERSLDMQPQDSGNNSDKWSDQQQDGRRRQDYEGGDGEGRQRPRRPFWEEIDE